MSRIDVKSLFRENISNLDQALYVASCFAFQSPARIYGVVVGDEERYTVRLDGEPAGPGTLEYTITRGPLAED